MAKPLFTLMYSLQYKGKATPFFPFHFDLLHQLPYSLITHLVQCIMEYKIQISKEDCTTNLAKSVHYSLLLACFQRMAATTGHAFFQTFAIMCPRKKAMKGKAKGFVRQCTTI